MHPQPLDVEDKLYSHRLRGVNRGVKPPTNTRAVGPTARGGPEFQARGSDGPPAPTARASGGGLHSAVHSCKTGSLGLLHMI